MERAQRAPSIRCHDGRPRYKRVRVTQTLHHWHLAVCLLSSLLMVGATARRCDAVGGVLVVNTEDEALQQPVAARMELYRAGGKPQIVRHVVPAGRGFVLNESIELALPDGPYQFRLTRGPEYRVIEGNFTLERTSQDERTVKLPRMVDMKSEGWISCDMAVPPKTADLRLRMIAEDLHFANGVGDQSDSTPAALMPANLAPYKPLWTVHHSVASPDSDLLFCPTAGSSDAIVARAGEISAQMIDRVGADDSVRIAVVNPFAWSLPVWLASGQVDGFFVLGDWLREDRRVEKIADGRPPGTIGFDGPRGPGRYAESIYWNLLEAGFRLAPLAGTGVKPGQTSATTIGYNRVYVTGGLSQDVESSPEPRRGAALLRSAADCLAAAWAGQSTVSNGPMLRPALGGYPPGHVFRAAPGETLHLDMQLNLSVRDEVDYLEIMHNGRVFHSARLDEFAAAGGRLPEMKIDNSGWVTVRVVTQHEDHFRLATSAPWYFEFKGAPRISRNAVVFFGTWLNDCEARLRALPAEELAKHVPYVVAARKFWTGRLSEATVD